MADLIQEGQGADARRVPLDSLGEQDRCLNCGAARSEVYCQRCGQRHVQDRLSVRSIVRELPSRVFSLDSGFLFTALRLWRGPGRIARDYVHGRRRRYTNPLTVFLIAASVQLLALAVIAPEIKATIVSNLEAGQAKDGANHASERIQELMGGDPNQKIADLYVTTLNQGYTYAAFFFFCVPWAVLLSLLHRRDPAPYRLGEHLIFTIYTVSQLLICTGLANVVTIHLGSTVQMTVSFLLYGTYTVVAHRGFYPRGAGSLAKTLVAFAISVAIFFSSLIGIFTVSFVVQLLLAKAAA